MKTFHRQGHHPLTVTYENTDLVHKCVVSSCTLRSMMGQEGCQVHHCCRQTMVSMLKLDHNEVRLLCKSIEGAFAKVSLNTPRPHTPCRLKFTLRSLTQVTVLYFVLRLSFYQTHDFLKTSSISHPASVFLFCYLSCTRNLIKPHCLGDENENFSQGHSPGPSSFFRHHTNTPTSYATVTASSMSKLNSAH